MANLTRSHSPRRFDFFRDFEQQMNELFEDFTRPVAGGTSAATREFAPLCDVHETDTHYVMSFDLPGISKEDINIEVDNNVLTVSGERREEMKEDKGERIKERFYGRFVRSFTLPKNVDENKVEAHYENGVLALGVPKSEGGQRKKIQVQEGKGGLFSKLVGSQGKGSGAKH